MKTYHLILITICVFIVSCSSWKTTLVSEGDVNDAIRNAVLDFVHTCYLHKKDSIFPIHVYIDNDSVIGLSLLGFGGNKLYPGYDPVDKIGTYSRSFPSRYIVCDKKLFYWYDSTKQITKEIVDVLKQYNHVDTMSLENRGVFFPFVLSEYAKGAHYYFCKNNLKIYKRVVTNKAMEWYTPPKLNCNKCKR